MKPLTFQHLREINFLRACRWHPGLLYGADEWTGSDWSNAAAGEMGEACNVVKKIRRSETGIVGVLDPSIEELKEKLAGEIADTIIYLDLLAAYYDINLTEAVVRTFNAVSDREGFPDKLDNEG